MAAKKNVQIIHATAPLPDIVRVAPYVRVSSLSDDQLHSFHLQYSHYHSLVTNTYRRDTDGKRHHHSQRQ